MLRTFQRWIGAFGNSDTCLLYTSVRAARDLAVLGIARAALADALLQRAIEQLAQCLRRDLPPVSYTHLDVYKRQCQGQVRFFALLRIKPHAPPLVRAPVNSFEF